MALFAFAVSPGEQRGMAFQQLGYLEQLFADVDDSVVPRRGLHATLFIKFLPGLGDRRLIRDSKHPHPAPEDPHLIDGVE